MILLLRLLCLGSILTGCAVSQRPSEVPCCAPPAPGTVSVRMHGEVAVSVGFGR